MQKQKTTITKSEFAKAEGISRSMVTRLVSQGLPVEENGRINTKLAEKWLATYRNDGQGCGAMDSLAEAQRRKENALARLRELEVAEREGQMVTIADATAAWAGLIGAARAKLLGMASSLGPEVALSSDPVDCAAIIDAAVREALLELSESKTPTGEQA